MEAYKVMALNFMLLLFFQERERLQLQVASTSFLVGNDPKQLLFFVRRPPFTRSAYSRFDPKLGQYPPHKAKPSSKKTYKSKYIVHR